MREKYIRTFPRLAALLHLKTRYGFSGQYRSWADACQSAMGYAEPNILRQVAKSVRTVERGSAAYERDGVSFTEKAYTWPLMTILCKIIASEHLQELNVLDFGGALGSLYRQNRSLLASTVKKITWSVVEQPQYVAYGREKLASPELQFFGSIAACSKKHHPHIAICSSVIQYIDNYKDVLQTLIEQKSITHLIFDRTPFMEKNHPEIITVQSVSPEIYPASYPLHIFNEKKFIRELAKGFRTELPFPSSVPEEGHVDGLPFVNKGIWFKRV